jgi:hypothetical protein
MCFYVKRNLDYGDTFVSASTSSTEPSATQNVPDDASVTSGTTTSER